MYPGTVRYVQNTVRAARYDNTNYTPTVIVLLLLILLLVLLAINSTRLQSTYIYNQTMLPAIEYHATYCSQPTARVHSRLYGCSGLQCPVSTSVWQTASCSAGAPSQCNPRRTGESRPRHTHGNTRFVDSGFVVAPTHLAAFLAPICWPITGMPTGTAPRYGRTMYQRGTTARGLVLFPTAHTSMCDCHSPRRVSVEITGLRCNQLAGPSPTCAPSTLAAAISDSAPNPCATAAAPTCPGRITSLRAISWRPRPNVHPAHCLLLFPTAHPIHARLPQPTTCPSRRWPHRSLAKTRSELATDPRRLAASQ